MKLNLYFVALLLLVGATSSQAQKIKFGKITKQDFEEKFYAKDSSASAVVLYKKRSSSYTYDQGQGWMLLTEIHERIRIFDREGFDYAEKKIKLYTGGEDEAFRIKAYTFNLENGKVSKTELNKKQIFRQSINEDWDSKNFTMPNLKEGCIVEWKYTIHSPYVWSIDDVICQYDIPIKRLEGYIRIPEYFVFNLHQSRYYPINVNKESKTSNLTIHTRDGSNRNVSLNSTGSGNNAIRANNVNFLENKYTFQANDIPGLKKEPYVNTMENYRAKLEFEISYYKPPSGKIEHFTTTWEDVAKSIYENPNFGAELNKSNHFNDDLVAVLSKTSTQNEQLVAIFQFVKSKMNWNEELTKYASKGVKKAYKDGQGNSAEINLTLIAMLREAGLKANPVLISTRQHGIPIFPTKNGYNSVIAAVEMGDKTILMDATDKNSLPDVLPRRDLNWEGRLVRKDGSWKTVNLFPKSYNLKDVKLNAVLSEDGSISGSLYTSFAGLNALEYRNAFSGVDESEIIEALEKEHNDIEIDQFKIRNEKDISKPIVELISFHGENMVDIIGDKIYISPLLFLEIDENPFKEEERTYPIDYASAWKNKSYVSLTIPNGYEVISSPESKGFGMSDKSGRFVMKTNVEGNRITVVAETTMNSPIVISTHYKELKDLYQKAIEHQLTKIVLQKKTIEGP